MYLCTFKCLRIRVLLNNSQKIRSYIHLLLVSIGHSLKVIMNRLSMLILLEMMG